MYTNFSLEEVIAAVDDFLVKSGLSDNTLSRYRRFGFNYFRDGFSAEGCYFYSEELAESLVAKFHQQVLNGQRSERDFRTIRKVHELMKEHVKNGKILYHDLPFWNIQYPCNELKEALVRYLASMEQSGYPELTIREANSIIRLFLLHMESKGKHTLQKLSFNHLNSENVSGFLAWLQSERGNSDTSCNQRLMAIRSFAKYAAISDPANIYLQAEIAKVPVRKCQSKVVEFFSDNALKALLEQPDRSKKTGLRNSCFMILMYDTGARCQEILDLRIKDLVLNEKSPYVYLTGKGNKTRTVPLMEKTAHHLNLYLNRFHPEGQRNREDYLFFTIIHQQRCTMSPDTVAAFLKKYADQARHSCADIPESVHPHQFRHTRAISWYRNGVPLILVSELLGHADINTSQIYAYADTEMKRKAISKALGDNSSNFQKDDVSRWKGDDELIKKLFALS